MGMEFFCCHRDRLGSVALRDELLEQHWAYMDQYAKKMIARGPDLRRRRRHTHRQRAHR
jgi:hypothetical protein